MMEEKMKDENGVVSSVSKIVLNDDLYSKVTTDLSSSLSSCIDTLSKGAGNYYYYDDYFEIFYIYLAFFLNIFLIF